MECLSVSNWAPWEACGSQVLDLDETLVHSTLDGCEQPDFSFPVAFNGREHQVHVRRRPHLDAFLQRCAALFEIVVFTASQKVYAEQLLNVLDPQRYAPPLHAFPWLSAVQVQKNLDMVTCLALAGILLSGALCASSLCLYEQMLFPCPQGSALTKMLSLQVLDQAQGLP